MNNIEDKVGEYSSQIFNNLNLSSKELTSKEFDDCVFKECDFGEVILNKSKFVDCHFISCNLSLVKIEQSQFFNVVFDECKLVGVDWTVASWSQYIFCSPVKFYKSILNDSSFFGLCLEEIEIEECKAHDVDFREGNFSSANFYNTDFTNSLFNKTNLTGASFIEAINYDIDVLFNEITKAKFSRFEAVRLLEGLDIELVD